MSQFPLKPTSAYIKAYYKALHHFHQHGYTTEGNTRSAFADLLKRCASAYDWKLVEEYQFKGTNKQPLRADGALTDELTLVHGLWEAKDTADDLQKEVGAKVAKGYPLTNILFQSPDRAILYQDSIIKKNCDLTQPENLVEVLQLFFEHRQPHEVNWEEAVLKFSEKIPDLAQGATKILNDEQKKNADFREKFQAFADLCRESINPDLTDDAIQKMLVQHLLTERIFRKVFNNQEFLSRNVIAAEIEKVIRSITSRYFSRDTFLQPLDPFYVAIEKAAEAQQNYTEKQHFLNAVYEKFFQSFDKKQADTHGIVYTPQPIVDFMVRSVEEVLQSEFGKSLSDENVHILDPFTGTGNFITRIMRQIKKSRLPQKYAEELHCNEVMLLPYYIASMNIEHAYLEAMQQYRPFEGICLVDTFELAEPDQTGFAFMNPGNAERVNRQRKSKIKVIIGNPPYNVGQDEENDDNKNRPYQELDSRVRDTYAKDSRARNRNSLRDPYIKAFRWAADRLGEEGGVVAFVTNSKFIHGKATDGVRKHLEQDFDALYVLDLGGDVRSNTKLSGTQHNVFQIQTGVAISILVKKAPHERSKQIAYARLDEFATRSQKLRYLETSKCLNGVQWAELSPNSRHSWMASETQDEFASLLPMSSAEGEKGIFERNSNGLKSNRDKWVFNFDKEALAKNIEISISFFNEHVERRRYQRKTPIDRFVTYDDKKISWSRDLKADVDRGTRAEFKPTNLRPAQYRPFVGEWVYFDRLMNEEIYTLEKIFPPNQSNVVIITTTHLQVPFSTQCTKKLPCVDVGERPSQCFPFYTYDEDGTNRRENITDWALDQYRAHYKSKSITKWDIFHSTYALLHHPEYRARYAANLKRELPRIPFPPNLEAFAKAGERLMELHVDYEKQDEYPLEEIENPKAAWTLRVEKMSLGKDKTELRYNDALTLRGIPPAVFDYRLGNRSALDWIIDQYRVSTDTRSGITNDPNRPDDERYILRLIAQVITVSLETMKIVNALPPLNLNKQAE